MTTAEDYQSRRVAAYFESKAEKARFLKDAREAADAVGGDATFRRAGLGSWLVRALYRRWVADGRPVLED